MATPSTHSLIEETEVPLYLKQLFWLKKAKKSPPPEIPVKKAKDQVEASDIATTASIESKIGMLSLT